MMSKLLTLLAAILIGTALFAQESDFNQMMREMYKQEFKEIVEENMNLTEPQSAVFDPIFDDFLAELGEVMDKRLATQAKYAKYFEGMTDEEAKEIQNEVFNNVKGYQNLIRKYTKKIGKEINPQTSFRFFLIVEKVKNLLDYSTIQSLPLVEN